MVQYPHMQFSVTSESVAKLKSDCVVVLVEEGKVDGAVGSFGTLAKQLKTFVTKEKFNGKAGQLFLFPTSSVIPSSYILLVGLGKHDKLTPYTFRKHVATAANTAQKKHISSIAVVVPQISFKDEATAQMIAEAAVLSTYRFSNYKSKESQKDLTTLSSVTLITDDKRHAALQKGVDRAILTSQATVFARDLVNEPPIHITPRKIAAIAQELSKHHGFSCTVFDEKQIKEMNMNAYLAVAAGSDEPPRLIKLHYKSAQAKKKIIIIGKGITFDSGGLSIKPSKSMETMKCDMAGAAAVLGVFSVLPQLKPTVEVVGLIAATENMISGKAIKPGDIVQARNGKYIEILNTDAEGRLTLADMLDYAADDKPDMIVDVATLTGACIIALGEQIAGLLGTSDSLITQLKNAAHTAGEKLWELPLEDEYVDLVKSTVADLRNISKGSGGGTITAALFLQEFVPNNTPWAHLDIAGPAFEERGGSALNPKGGTGFAVRTLLEWLQNF